MNVKLYRMNISKLANQSIYDECLNKVSDERRAKVDRMHAKGDKCRSLAAGVLLNEACDMACFDAKDRELAYEKHGKPYFVNRSDYHFSLSHSGDWVILAFINSSSEIGADIEKYSEYHKIEKIVPRILSLSELEEFNKTPTEMQDNRIGLFYSFWTIKESYVKALGLGLSLDFRLIESFSYCKNGKDVIKVVSDETPECFYIKKVIVDDGYDCSICSKYEDITIEDIVL